MKRSAPTPSYPRKVVVLDIGEAGSSTGPGTIQHAVASQDTLVASQLSRTSTTQPSPTLAPPVPTTYDGFFSQPDHPAVAAVRKRLGGSRPAVDPSFCPTPYVPPRPVPDNVTVSELLPSMDNRGSFPDAFIMIVR
ncbi:hypothetical protein PENSPDRAFT_680652 [Peniophora sp. CONT]|nr:hypothetical protein PENSPDRAFT_680652 [Peniophora sp. CONT]